MKNTALALSALLFACVACPAIAQDKTYSTIAEESSGGGPTGDLITNGVITPIDQEMRHFYIRNADGAIEVRLTDDAVIGLQTRIQRGGFGARKVEFTVWGGPMTKRGGKAFSYNLPKDLYVNGLRDC
ncbi:hypothetical protein HQ576_15345 [bacterium]|nr:hypothetical protein [bacterium]